MEQYDVKKIIEQYLADMNDNIESKIVLVEDSLERLLFGWSFIYQSEKYLKTDDFLEMLVGHGPVVILNDGRILEGGSVDLDAEAALRRFGVEIGQR